MIMKRFLKYTITLLVVIMVVPMITNAQTIKRQKQKSKTEQAQKKPKQGNSLNSAKSSKSSKSSRSDGGMSQVQRDHIIQRAIDDMVHVVGGTFMMGATAEQGSAASEYEKPAHQVTLSGYYIGRYEVTQELWQAVMGNNPSNFKGDSRRPVECVSWNDCQKFIMKLNRMTGKRFRLPTEAEWEYAARGGNQSKGYKYSGGNTLDNVAWYWNNSGSATHPVGTKAPNELGLYDMTGNVYEICQDWSDSYSSDSQINPTGPSLGTHRVDRGGGWAHGAWENRVSYRSFSNPSEPSRGLGLRLAADSL